MEDPEVYLRRHQVMTYVQDAVGFLLERKDEQSKLLPLEVLAEYFRSVKNGTHVIFRDHAFITATPHNRTSFIKLFAATYAEISARNQSMRISDYLSLLRLLCPDFPSSVVERIDQVLFTGNKMENLISFPDFLHCLQVVVYYQEFLHSCEALFRGGQYRGNTVVVAMPSATEHAQTLPTPTQSELFPTQLALESAALLAGLASLVERGSPSQPRPSLETMYELVKDGGSVSLLDFVLCLVRSERVSEEIGALPAAQH